MKKNILKGLGLLAVIVLASSCNRGAGCPNQFSISDTIQILKDSFLAIL